MTTDFLEKIQHLFDELGEPLKSGMSGELLMYSALWSDLKAEQKLKGFEGADDVRVADYLLKQLGIPANYVEADDSGQDGRWRIYWR